MSQSDCDVDGGAHSALTAAVLKVGTPPCPHRKVQRDASAKSAHVCGCNGHRRRRMVRPRPPRVRCSSRLRGRRDCSQSLLLQVHMEFWDAAGPRDRLNFQNLMEDPVRVNGCESILCFCPCSPSGVRSQQCGRWDADFSSSQGAERRYSEEATFAGATGIGGAGWFRSRPTRVRCPSRLRENRDCAQSLFLKYSWKSGGADMLPCVTTLK